MNEHLGWLYNLSLVNNVAENTEMHMFLWCNFIFYGYKPHGEIIVLYNSSISSFLRNFHTVMVELI